MTLTTDEYWEVDGVALNTLARNIETWGGSRLAPPPMRGSDQRIPLRPGDKWRKKLADSRTITFGMWVQGCDDDGIVPADSHAEFNQNWSELRRLMWKSYRQVALVKRERRPSGLITATASAQFYGGLEPGMLDPASAKFTVDMHLADPYFYMADVVEDAITDTATITPDSDDVERKLTLAFSGGGPYTLTNAATGRELTVDNTGAIDVDCWNFTAIKAGVSVGGDLSVTGDDDEAFWMTLIPEDNDLTVTGGQVVITRKPVIW